MWTITSKEIADDIYNNLTPETRSYIAALSEKMKQIRREEHGRPLILGEKGTTELLIALIRRGLI